MNQPIFIDATYSLASGKNSGIERVVHSLVRESRGLGQAGEIPVPQLVLSLDGKFYAADDRHVAAFRKIAAAHSNVLGRMPLPYRMLAQAVCRLTGSQKLRKWLLPQAGHLGLFKLPHALYESWVRRRVMRHSPPLAFGPGDVLLLPDAYWVGRVRDSVWSGAEQARAEGARIATVMYDLIPLTHPEFVGLKRRDAFLDYLRKAATHSDLLMAISQTVRDQVAAYLPTLAGPGDHFCQHIHSFQLGAELENASGTVRREVRELFAGPQTPYLMVATFDPRKNHRYLLDAFDLLWRQRPELKLVLVGRIGSRCGELVQRIMQHPLLNQRLFLFSDLSDAELQHCYAASRGVIFPSIVEGYGLPIVESLWFGRKTFVSDTPIHREVGRGDCCYFGLADPQALVAEILKWETALAAGQTPQGSSRKPVTWRESTRQLLQRCGVAAPGMTVAPRQQAA